MSERISTVLNCWSVGNSFLDCFSWRPPTSLVGGLAAVARAAAQRRLRREGLAGQLAGRRAENGLEGQGGTGLFLVRRRAGPRLHARPRGRTGHGVGFDAVSGKELWKHSYPAELGDKFFEGGTTGTPTVAGDRVFTLSRWGDVFCFEAATGKIVWSKNVQKETGAPIPDWGFTGAPLVHENLLVLNVGDAGLALDKTTGKIVWKSANKNCRLLDAAAGAARREMVGVARQWNRVRRRQSRGRQGSVARALGHGVRRQRQRPDRGGRPDVSFPPATARAAGLFKLGAGEPEELWKTKKLRTQLNAAVLFKGHLYGVDGDTTQKASLKCLDFATGEEKWAQPGFGSGGVIVADGKLIAFSGTGELMVAPATPTGFKPDGARAGARRQVLDGARAGQWPHLLPQRSRRCGGGGCAEELIRTKSDYESDPTSFSQNHCGGQPRFQRRAVARRRAGPQVSHRAHRLRLVGQEHPQGSDGQRAGEGRRAVRRGRQRARSRRGSGERPERRPAEDLQGLPRAAGEGEARDRHHRHAGSLARAADHRRAQGRRACVRREAHRPHGQRKPRDAAAPRARADAWCRSDCIAASGRIT